MTILYSIDDEYDVKDTDCCDFCGTPATETILELCAHGAHLACGVGKCKPHYDHPRRRRYAELTPETLDGLEYQADDVEAIIGGVSVPRAVLHSLIRAARKDLEHG